MERDKYWDIIKGLGIIAVVLGHTGVLGYFVSLYHLPLFFFVAGHFYNDKYTNDIFAYFGKKLKTLWWPMFKYTVFFIVFHNVFVYFHFIEGIAHENYLPGEYIDKYQMLRSVILAFWGQHIEVLGGPMWFVIPLLSGLLVFSIVRNLRMKLPKKIQFYGEFLLIILFYLLGTLIIKKQIPIPYWGDLALIVLPIIYSGFISKNYIKKLVPQNTIFLLLSVFISIGILNYCVNHKIIILLSEKMIYHPVGFVVITLIGIYMNLVLGILISKVKLLVGIFSYIGEKSFHIMALHFICFKMINIVYILVNNMSYSFMPQVVITMAWWPLYLLAGIGMPLCFVYIYDFYKSKLFRERIRTIKIVD